MEAAAAHTSLSTSRELTGEKATRIVEAMRLSVADRGIAGSTFDHVAREAGVSRGLLHYYFATKERLLVEVVRRECDVRIERLERAIGDAQDPDGVLAALVSTFELFLDEGPAAPVMFYELTTLAQRNAEIAAELAELERRTTEHLAEALRVKHETGAIALHADSYAVASFLFVLADGVTVRRLAEPRIELEPLMELAVAAARGVLG